LSKSKSRLTTVKAAFLSRNPHSDGRRRYFRFPLPFPFPFGADWLTLTVVPATTKVVVRATPVLAGTEIDAVPLAEPEPVTAAHEADEDAQLQPLEVVTVTVLELAVAAKARDVGDTE
jgi:hypothetical protein